MRSTHGVKWNVLPSNGMNQPYRQNIEIYRMKITQAMNQDENLKNVFN